jgi:hypothetical protein
MQNALELAAALRADIAPAGDCLRGIFKPLLFAGNVRHCCERLMTDRASLDCIAKNLSCFRSLVDVFFGTPRFAIPFYAIARLVIETFPVELPGTLAR